MKLMLSEVRKVEELEGGWQELVPSATASRWQS